MPVFDTVLWDWNGTLLDDAALCCELLNTMLARHGYAPVGSMEAYRQVFCFPIETYYRRAGFDFSRHPFAALADEYMRLYTPRSLGCPLQPDACAVLDALRAQGMRQVMLSASKQENLQQQIDDEEENQKAIEEQAEYQNTDAYIEDLAREKLGLVHEDEIIFKKK